MYIVSIPQKEPNFKGFFGEFILFSNVRAAFPGRFIRDGSARRKGRTQAAEELKAMRARR